MPWISETTFQCKIAVASTLDNTAGQAKLVCCYGQAHHPSGQSTDISFLNVAAGVWNVTGRSPAGLLWLRMNTGDT